MRLLSKWSAMALMLCVGTAQAANIEPFNQARFQQLQTANKPVLVEVSADWCPTCQQQHNVLESYLKDHPKTILTIQRVDFDTQKEWVSYFKAPRQSTLILFQHGKQSWFSVGETRKTEIYKVLDSVK